jgi:UDP-glucose 4-epimerase
MASKGNFVYGLGHGLWPEMEYSTWGIREWRNGAVAHANLDAMVAHCGVPDFIFHLAGGSAVGPSYVQPAEDFHRSVASANELVEWMRLRAPATRLVMASSAAVYGSGYSMPIPESAPCAPYSPYGFHKRMTELAIETYARSFGLKAVVVRLFSVYGTCLQKQLLWDACTRLMTTDGPLSLGGSGREIRDWLHVEDAVRLLAHAAEYASCEMPVINGGTGIEATISDIANHLCACWGRTEGVNFSGQSRSGDPHALIADVTQMKSLCFEPAVRWQDGIREYVAWFRNQQHSVQPVSQNP